MLNEKKDTKRILSITAAILAVALVYSMASSAFAAAGEEQVASIANLGAPIKNS